MPMSGEGLQASLDGYAKSRRGKDLARPRRQRYPVCGVRERRTAAIPPSCSATRRRLMGMWYRARSRWFREAPPAWRALRLIPTGSAPPCRAFPLVAPSSGAARKGVLIAWDVRASVSPPGCPVRPHRARPSRLCGGAYVGTDRHNRKRPVGGHLRSTRRSRSPGRRA